MNKYVLAGLASSASFMTFFLMAYPANANASTASAVFSSSEPVISLNWVSASLNSTLQQQDNPILDHIIGCNCPTCVRSSQENPL